MSKPSVASVHRSERHTFSKASQEAVRLVAGWGVEGDAHAGRTDQHRFHVRKFGAQPNLREVHLIASELLDDLHSKGHAVQPGELGENITTRQLNLLALPAGTRLRIGAEAMVELTGLRNPCHQIEGFQPGLLAQLVERAPHGIVRKAGVMAIVVESGWVRAGDSVHVELPVEPHMPLVYRTPESPHPRGIA